MKLKDQVCSLKLAKKLKELGVKQESLWYWYCDEERDDTDILNRDEKYAVVGFFTHKYSAFTVAELGEMLPSRANNKNVVFGKIGEMFEVYLYRKDEEIVQGDEYFRAETEANARAKMLIYLKKQEGG